MRNSIADRRVGCFGFRSWIGAAALFVFLAGIGHVWLHDTHISDDSGHYSAAVEKACPSKKLVSAITVFCPFAGANFERVAVQLPLRQWFRFSRDFSTAPRGPPLS